MHETANSGRGTSNETAVLSICNYFEEMGLNIRRYFIMQIHLIYVNLNEYSLLLFSAGVQMLTRLLAGLEIC